MSYYKILTFLIAAVWIINGLLCKVLNLVPRHEEIVSRILGDDYSRPLIIIIGVSEILMALWVLSQFKRKLNAIIQIVIVAVMNIIEFIFASDLLLWNKLNIIFALVFIVVVYYTNFILGNTDDSKS